jgi:hypothetical protein
MNTIRTPVPKLSNATAGRAWSRLLATGLLLAPVLAFAGSAAAHDRRGGPDVSLDIHYGSAPFADDPWLVDFVGYYGCSPVVVDRYCRAGFPPDDLAVAVYLADRSGVSLDLVVNWRRHGLAWADVARRCRVEPAVFITPIAKPGRACGIYTRPYSYWSRYPKYGWRLSDAEARELVYLRFASDRYDCDPGWVMRERSQGRAWREMASAWREDGPGYRGRNADQSRGDRDDHRGHGRNHGRGPREG